MSNKYTFGQQLSELYTGWIEDMKWGEDPEKQFNEVVEFVEQSPYTYLGEGENRIVYGNDEWVIKIPNTTYSNHSNISELRAWNKSSTYTLPSTKEISKQPLRYYLAEMDVEASGPDGKWIWMKNINTNIDPVSQKYISYLQDSVEQYGLISEPYEYNMGHTIIDGEAIPLFYDYE